ncbi:hypothetical protein A9Q83_08075 [Alphaproteobacteria bacterium 46_93_T64]|nr:hypothetical protein A9Q83_08075 [Alphaproteobacteria bacterium 46_93_T64]
MLRYLLLSAVIFLLNACVTNGALGPTTYEKVGSSAGFYQYSVKWSQTYRGQETQIYLKTRENAENLEICGYYIGTSGSLNRLVDAWLNEAEFYMNDKTVVATRFLIEQSKITGSRAACVVTGTKYTDLKSKRDLRIRGNRVTVSF